MKLPEGGGDRRQTMTRAWDWRRELGAKKDRFLCDRTGHMGGGVAGFGQWATFPPHITSYWSHCGGGGWGPHWPLHINKMIQELLLFIHNAVTVQWRLCSSFAALCGERQRRPECNIPGLTWGVWPRGQRCNIITQSLIIPTASLESPGFSKVSIMTQGLYSLGLQSGILWEKAEKNVLYQCNTFANALGTRGNEGNGPWALCVCVFVQEENMCLSSCERVYEHFLPTDR